ncbi:MAG: hypothetical protein Q9162_004023 [Coniocarpon cinnabarinum]
MKHGIVSEVKAPSVTLLKYLRAQRDGRAFFSSNTTLQHHTQCNGGQRISKTCSRSITLAAAPLELIESNVFSWHRPTKRNYFEAPPGNFARSSFYASERAGQTLSINRARHDHAVCDGKNERRSWRRWWTWKKRPTSENQQSENAGLSPFLDDDATLGKRMRSANELRMRCTELDDNGHVTLVNGEFKKGELIAKYDLLPRDLRKIDSSLLPTILIRPSAILVNLLHLRVLIKHNRVLVFDAYGTTDSYIQSLFMSDLEEKLRTPETRTPGSSTVGAALPYEFRALEAVLISVTSGLEGEFEGVRDPIVRVLRELEEDIDRDKLRQLLIYSKKLSSFEQKARLVRDAIDDLLEADDDLAAMYLSEKAQGKERELDDHTEVEMLLENYYQVADEIVQVSGNLVSNIRNTEEIVKAILDANRNVLMLLDLKFTILTFGAGSATFFAALYGMNLKNFWEESDFAFAGVSVFSAICGIFVCRWGLRKLAKVQKVSMWGQTAGDTQKGRQGWAVLGEKQSDKMMSVAKRERLRGVREGHVISSARSNQSQFPST